MTEAPEGRRKRRQQETLRRRRSRRKAAAAAALGGVVLLGTAGGAASGEDLRATAGIQLAGLAIPLFAGDAPVPSRDGTDTAPPAPGADAGTDPADAGTASPDGPAGDGMPADQAADSAAADMAAEAAAAETAAAETAAAEAAAAAAAAAQQTAADAAAEGAAEQAAAEAERIAVASVPVDDPAGAKAYAASVLGSHGWEASQMSCLDTLWTKESEWLTSATNASSGAYGIPQALPGTKLATAGSDWQTNYQTQINWGLGYIQDRYGSPCSALNFHYANNWY